MALILSLGAVHKDKVIASLRFIASGIGVNHPDASGKSRPGNVRSRLPHAILGEFQGANGKLRKSLGHRYGGVSHGGSDFQEAVGLNAL